MLRLTMGANEEKDKEIEKLKKEVADLKKKIKK